MKWASIVVCSFLLAAPLLLPAQTIISRPAPIIIHIKARFVEMPQSFITDTARNYLHADITNGTVLPNPIFQVFLHEAETQKDAEELAEPEVTTISGRQTQMRSTVIQPIVTKYVYGESSSSPPGPVDSSKIFSDGSSGFVPEVQQVETGPVLDVVPMVLPGNYKIDLKTTASLIGFLGYADTKNLPANYATNAAGKKIVIPTVQPEFQVKQASLQATIYDGQTLVLFPQQNETSESIYPDDEKSSKLVAQYIKKTEEKYPNKILVVFVTATLIDPAGNRLHSDDE